MAGTDLLGNPFANFLRQFASLNRVSPNVDDRRADPSPLDQGNYGAKRDYGPIPKEDELAQAKRQLIQMLVGNGMAPPGYMPPTKLPGEGAVTSEDAMNSILMDIASDPNKYKASQYKGKAAQDAGVGLDNAKHWQLVLDLIQNGSFPRVKFAPFQNPLEGRSLQDYLRDIGLDTSTPPTPRPNPRR